jgi:hypothetical protein
LLHGDGTNGAQNNTFLDSSTNNFTITRNGNTTQGSFSPFSQTGWGNYFDGATATRLTMPSNTAFAFGTGAYTVEAWVYLSAHAATQTTVVDCGAATNSLNFSVLSTGALSLGVFGVGATLSSAGGAVTLNTWNHVAVVRESTASNATKLYVNGTAVATGTDAGNYTVTTTPSIGGLNSSGFTATGYISNVRLVKGTAVYTANFTPPTTPLTAITNTSLLTCQANRFLDASSNAFAITANGNVSVQPFSPFNPLTPYSTSAVGGSGYFDGSGDYLSAASNSAFSFGSGDFTVEAWIYRAASGAFPIFTNGPTSSGSFAVYVLSDVIRCDYYVGTSLAGTTTIPVNAWTHVAVTRSGSNLNVYLNGVRDNTTTTSSNNTSSDLAIGRDWTNGSTYSNGYISSLRVLKGSAQYTGATYTVPTAPLTAIANTSLLLNFTNAGIFDNAADADYETVGNAQISTSVKKYGTGSVSFDGSGDYIVAAPMQTLAPGAGDFCYEFWLYANSSSNACIFDTRAANNNTTGFACLLNGSSQIALYTNSTILTCGTALSASVWYHVAVTRTAGVIKVFLNGTQIGSLANTSNFSDKAFRVGQYVDGTGSLNGYVDDLRISNGVGRYPYNFTPPTAEFPNIGGTVTLTADPYFDYTTLLLPGNGTNGAQNNTFLDSSTNAFSITRNGNTTQGTFSPFSQTGWGNYFNFATPDALRPSATAISNFGTGAFTIEFWVNFQSTSAAGFYYGGASGSVYIDYFSGSLRLGISGGSVPISYAFTPAVGTWYHVAFVRSSTTDTLYVNGTSVATGSDSQNYPSDSGPYVGSWSGASYTGAAYISNLRIVKGSAVYTANFTPSTTPLTAISGTSLLTCQSNRFVDNSSNAFAITTNGSPSVQAFSPFNPTAAWSAATYGGSGYFDGSGDSLTATNNAAYDFGSGAFTIEAWAFPTTASQLAFAARGQSTGFEGWIISTTNFLATTNGSSWDITITFTTALTANAWNHVAIVRNGNVYTAYLNGVANGTTTVSGSIVAGTAVAVIGRRNGQTDYSGYISNLRIVKGTAVYTANFTPPTAPLTAITNTSLLTNFTNAGIYDATSKNDLETVGNAQISTTQSKFGGSSMYFDGTGDYLYRANNPNVLGSGDWTIEGWYYQAGGSGYRVFVSTRTAADGGAAATVFFGLFNNVLFYDGSTSGGISIVGGTSISASTWNHVALVRYGSTVTMYLNGVSQGTATDSNNKSNADLWVGGQNTLYYLNGYIDDLRITKGIARYTSNFTPPTTAFLTL